MRLVSRSILAVFALPAVFAAGQTVIPIRDAAGQSPMHPSYLTLFDNYLYFRASNAPSGTDAELWRTDGRTAERAADVLSGPEGSSPAYLTGFNGKLYFQANGPSGANRLYQFDPKTSAASLAPGSAANASLPDELTVYNNTLFFRATNFATVGAELWKFDGTTQTPMNIYPGTGSSYPQHFIQYNGLLYFNANGQSGQGSELYRTNGTTVVNVATLYPGNGSSPENFCVYNNKLFFSAYDGVRGRELWSYDSASNQAQLAADIVPGVSSSSSNPSNLAVYKGKLYFQATDGQHGYELWAYDGHAAAMVAEINPTPNPYNGDDWMMDSSPTALTVFHDKLYFVADDGAHGRELWSFDGTTARMVLDLNPGSYGSGISELVVFNDTLYLAADALYNSAQGVPDP
ncbi:MAG: hypothetical protein ACM359_18235, partial [Bacillota bacterium]